jgi:hypothetical protein
MRWLFSLMRAADFHYILFIELAALDAAWAYYRTGRLFDAARVLSAAAAETEEAGIIVLGREKADALRKKHPRGVWLGGCPLCYGPVDPVQLYLLLGLEGSRPEEEMHILPVSKFGPHGELLCITEELLRELTLEDSEVLLPDA